jgi:hypothetical protein
VWQLTICSSLPLFSVFFLFFILFEPVPDILPQCGGPSWETPLDGQFPKFMDYSSDCRSKSFSLSATGPTLACHSFTLFLGLSYYLLLLSVFSYTDEMLITPGSL